MSNSIRYLLNEQGERVGVILDFATYQQLRAAQPTDSDLLVGMSEDELQALAESSLSPAAQAHLEQLLSRCRTQELSAEEVGALDRLLGQIDLLNMLKARAKYTLQRLSQVRERP